MYQTHTLAPTVQSGTNFGRQIVGLQCLKMWRRTPQPKIRNEQRTQNSSTTSQDTVQEMAKDMKSKSTGQTQASASQLYDFMKRVRAGEPISNYELMKFTPLFNDELTLDNLERVHLVNLCRFVGISPFGTDAFLVSRLRHHLGEIRVRLSPRHPALLADRCRPPICRQYERFGAPGPPVCVCEIL